MHEHINVKNNTLFIEECRAEALAHQYKTPLYVLSESSIRQKCHMVQNEFLNRYENVYAAYASKALLTSSLVRIIHQEGLYMDVVSGGELYTAIHADFPTDKIIFHGNNKSLEELEFAVKHQVGRIVVDNLYELSALDTICTALNRKAKILFRMTPGVVSSTHDYIATGKKDSKFGWSMDEAILFPALQKVLDQPLFDFLGFHFHVGSQIFDHTSHVQATEILLDLIKRVKEVFGFTIKELNTGGGYGVKYTEQDEPKSIGYFTDAIMSKIISYCREQNLERPSVFIEPGRFIVGEAGVTLYTIGSIKEIPGIRTYVAVDGGMTDNIRPALYQAHYEARIVNKVDAPHTQTVTLCVKCCETGDILIEKCPLPEVKEDDIIAVFTTGAYNYSMASHYNKHTIPAMVLVSGDQHYEIIRRESYEDLVKYDQIPEHLK